MAKPQWLIDKEQTSSKLGKLCKTCIHYGKIVGQAKHKNKEWVEIHECAIHPKCFNSKYSIQCEDYLPKET